MDKPTDPGVSQDELTPTARQVLHLLDYIEEVERLKTKRELVIPTDAFCMHQHEWIGLPDIQFNRVVNGDDIWLTIPRLIEIQPPELDPELGLWVTLNKRPDVEPKIRSELTQMTPNGEQTLVLKDLPEIQAQFDWYLESMWRPWANTEAPRRKVMGIYQKLFQLHRTMIGEGADQPQEWIWGFGQTTWKHPVSGIVFRHPLILQICDLGLNKTTLDLEVRPKASAPRLKLDSFQDLGSGQFVAKLEGDWKAQMRVMTTQINPFDPKTYEDMLNTAAGLLDDSGTYFPGGAAVVPADPGPRLCVYGNWVTFIRKRSSDIFVEDIRKLREHIESNVPIPSVVASFVTEGADEVVTPPTIRFRGLSSSETCDGIRELYFPLPYNAEQVAIVQNLEHRDGAVCQGPPGTGKTHTIANVISHYLAHGKRVLVTAKGETALSVLQDKLPKEIRALSVALLSNEHDGKQQFELSIRTIAEKLTSLSLGDAEMEVRDKEQTLDGVHRSISRIDQEIAQLAGKHMTRYSYRGANVTAEQLAQHVVDEAESHQWMDDQLSTDGAGTLSFTDEDVLKLRVARQKVREDLHYRGCTVPHGDDFPVGSRLKAIHSDLMRAKVIEAHIDAGALFSFVDAQPETLERAKALKEFLGTRSELHRSLDSRSEPWVVSVHARFEACMPDEPVLETLAAAIGLIGELELERRTLRGRLVDIPAGAEHAEDLHPALTRLAAGRAPFALPFGYAEIRTLLRKITVRGEPVKAPADWALVKGEIAWRKRAHAAIAQWRALSREFDLPVSDDAMLQAFPQVANWCSVITDIRRRVHEHDQCLHARIEPVFGQTVAAEARRTGEALVEQVQLSIVGHLDRERLAYARRQQTDLLLRFKSASGPIVENAMRWVRSLLGTDQIDEAQVDLQWDELRHELSRVADLRAAFEEIERVTALIQMAGAPKWAQRLRTSPPGADEDPETPSSWRDAWNWRKADLFLEKIDGKHLVTWYQERRRLTQQLSITYQELVAKRAWLMLKSKAKDNVRQHLSAYLSAITKMPKGQGVRKLRFQIDARRAMENAYSAVPCWIMPQHRVSESIPAELGLFDLVVIDEASQSDIWAVPALLRGKKLLVVGDDKQVSPSMIGVPESDVLALKERFLDQLPHGAQLTIGSSIYDLATVLFASSSVMLKEHFRCVPTIIEYSNREYYQNQIQPLRLPTARERLDPPLIDVLVKGGYREREINKPEAEAIVQRVEAIISDERFRGRSIGVVTLVGNNQAPHIQQLLSQRIPIPEIIARKIRVGTPADFQGQERDIILMSMVLGPRERSPPKSRDIEQRVNVAMSRAADRMILFRSVEMSDYAEDTIVGKILRHFHRPYERDQNTLRAMRELCQSGFELEMFDEIAANGYRFRPQVKCAGYSMDFVIEGGEGRRLAVECDGDRFHGPDRWRDDMFRQRVLERAGWTFWRCFGSDFTRRRKEVLGDLWNTLRQQGIEPLGFDSEDRSSWTSFEEVDPCPRLDPTEAPALTS